MWTDQTAKTFIDYGRYFVPQRESQIEIICNLVPTNGEPFRILELACGEGLLAEALLDKHSAANVYGLDASQLMLEQAKKRLVRFGDRFEARIFDLFDRSWRKEYQPVQAVVSSLSIHHMDGNQKSDLFKDMYKLLDAGGGFIIADVIQPANEIGIQLAADAWDAAVKRRAIALDGEEAAFDYFRRERWNMFRHSDPIDKPSTIFEQLRWLEEAGFGDVDVYWMAAGHAIFGGIKPSI
jgi:tRNA (cmo5U34)-methyltransferase